MVMFVAVLGCCSPHPATCITGGHLPPRPPPPPLTSYCNPFVILRPLFRDICLLHHLSPAPLNNQILQPLFFVTFAPFLLYSPFKLHPSFNMTYSSYNYYGIMPIESILLVRKKGYMRSQLLVNPFMLTKKCCLDL